MLRCGMRGEMIKRKVEVASHGLDLRASRFPRAKGKHQGEGNECILQLFLGVSLKHSIMMGIPCRIWGKE